jgi:predicted RNA-binding protein YlxR (DUF448 family)
MNVTTEERKRPQKPARTCVGCARSDDASAMVRLVIGPGGEVAVDLGSSAFGRGAHVHAAPECLAKACKGGLARSFKTNVRASVAEIAEQIVTACDRRVASLVGSAMRAGVLAVGADAACSAMNDGAYAVIVAADAGSVAKKLEIAGAVAEGRAIAWGSKASLGEILGKGEVAVCALRDARIAKELVSMVSIRSRCFACRSEVR